MYNTEVRSWNSWMLLWTGLQHSSCNSSCMSLTVLSLLLQGHTYIKKWHYLTSWALVVCITVTPSIAGQLAATSFHGMFIQLSCCTLCSTHTCSCLWSPQCIVELAQWWLALPWCSATSGNDAASVLSTAYEHAAALPDLSLDSASTCCKLSCITRYLLGLTLDHMSRQALLVLQS